MIATKRCDQIVTEEMRWMIDGVETKIFHLKHTGDFSDWEFAIYNYSHENYDPNEMFFPGMGELDGTIKGAMLAGMEAYPL